MRKAVLLATALAFAGSGLATAAPAPFAPFGQSMASDLGQALTPVATRKVIVKKTKPNVVVKKKVRRGAVVTTPAERSTTVTTTRSGTTAAPARAPPPRGGAGVSVGGSGVSG